MTASALWSAVVSSYDTETLAALTNINDPASGGVDTSAGEDAAQEVIDLWPTYAQADYDASDSQIVSIAKFGVLAILWRRGGSSTNAETVKWDEVFGSDGMIAKWRESNPRGHPAPTASTETQRSSELMADGSAPRPIFDRDSLPNGLLPRRRSSQDT